MLFVACWYGLLCAPLVRADGWDDFSNNLATDLAPLLSLFGEQITKQYLSESISKLDYFIFAMAPMGIMTAVVSAIRVCGSPSLRAFIGRAQEGAGNAEVELCSSTSRDVCELYNNGGIARVFGRPKVLEIVYNPAGSDFDKTAGIYTFREYLNSENGQKEWECVQKDNQDLEKNYKHSAFAPNLSLNVGIKKQSPLVFWTVALAGFVLQAGVLVFAVIATYYLQWNKDSSRPESYACPLAIIGTLLVCGGNFLCAFLVGQSTQELVYRKREIIGKNSQMPSSIYWVQPGGQSLGDQIFDPFCYNDRARPLNEYTTSWKNQSDGWTKKSEMVVWIAVSATISGFIMQFVGLRGIHSAISVAQLGAIIVMSAARAALRMQRLKPGDNFLSNCPDEVVGHELDWPALRIGDQYVSQAFPNISSLPRHCFWKFCGSLDNLAISKSQCQPAAENLQVASNILAYRTRLARLTYAPISQTKVLGSAECFTAEMVEVRESARRLALVIELVTNTVYSLSHEIHQDWKNALSIPWEIVCDVTESPSMGLESKTYTAGSQVRPGLRLELIRESQESSWKFKDKMGIEGLLGLWVWSLKSDPAVEISDSQSGLTLSRSSEISVRRIVTVNRDFAEVDLKVWSDGVIPRIALDKLHPQSTRDADANMLWKRDRALSGCYKPFLEKLPVELDGIVRFIGWHTTVMLRGQDPDPFNVWSAPTQSSLLSICAQEVFGSFLKCILSVVSNIGSIEIQQETPGFRLRNDLVSALTNNFTESRLGPREEALLCVLPPVVSQLSLSSTKGALEAAKRNAHHHRRHGRWQEADAILRWALRVETATSNSHSETALIALGELYRWALRHDAAKSFGFEGIKWLATSDHKQPLTVVAISVVERYSDLARKMGQPKNHDRPGIFLRAMRGNLCEALLYLTLPDPISDKQKGQLLYSAAIHNRIEVAFALLELGADAGFKDRRSRTALFRAADNGGIEMLKVLINGGAFPNSADTNQRTPISYASEKGHGNIVVELLSDERVDPDVTDKYGKTPCWRALERGHKTIVRMLLDTGKVDPDAKDNDGQMPLIWAAKNGHETIIKTLLDTGKVDPDAKDNNEQTPLYWAAENGHETIVKTLLDTGKVDLNTKDNNGRTPLIWAAENGHETIVKTLLDTYKVDPDEVFNLLADTMRSEEQHIATNRMVTKATLVVDTS